MTGRTSRGRGSGYSACEDVHLCQISMKISQEYSQFTTGSDQFWSLVEESYNKSKKESWDVRSKRSVQSRVQDIERAVSKLHECINQVKTTNPSGPSNDQDILDQAKVLLMQDGNYKKGFMYDHVWNIYKDFDKFKDNLTMRKNRRVKHPLNYVSLESDNPVLESHTTLSPIPINSIDDDDDIDGSTHERPTEAKKCKLKRRNEEIDANDIVVNQNQEIIEMLKKANVYRQQSLEIQQKKLALKELIRDDKMLVCDLNTIRDSSVRAHIQAQQALILQKRNG